MIEKTHPTLRYESLDNDSSGKLSLFFATLCVIDLFGVFPIVTLPRSLISCGYLAIPLLLLVFSLQTYTAVVLGRCWVIAEKIDPSIIDKSRYAYAAIGEMTFGKYMKIFVTILLDLTVFGAGIPNLLVASQNIELLGLRISSGSFDFSFCYYLIIIGILLCPIMWLGSPKNMKALASTSVLICSTVAILTWVCVLKESDDPAVVKTEEFDPLTPPFLNLLKAYGVISFQFDIHPMLLTIQVDMKDRNKIGKAVFGGLFTTMALSIITTLLVNQTYGQSITANVLQSLPKGIFLYIIILLVALQLCLSSVVGNSALFQHVEDSIGIPKEFNFRRCIVRSVFVCLAVTLAEFIPKFDLVMGENSTNAFINNHTCLPTNNLITFIFTGVIGGTLTGPLIFILPPLFYTRMKFLEHKFYKNLKIKEDDELKLNDTEMLIRSATNYGSIQPSSDYNNSYKESRSFFRCRLSSIVKTEYLIASVVVIFGVAATLTSTFYNVIDVHSLNEFWSPCIQNISLSKFLLPK